MPQKGRKVSSYCHHKASGRAVVRLDGVDVDLGLFGSEESHGRYQAAITEWRARLNGATGTAGLSASTAKPFLLTINDLIARYAAFAAEYYSCDGKPTKELQCMKDALRPLRRMYEVLPVAEFGPLKLKAVRQSMIDQGWCRRANATSI